MTYFDDKEEVLEIQLTPYGEALLSRGEFEPVYYQFFDDDVIYDSEYINDTEEEQNDIQTRIKEETPRLRVQSVYSSRSEAIKQTGPLIVSFGGHEFEAIQDGAERRALVSSLGDSAHKSVKAPAWEARALLGTIEDIEEKKLNSHPVYATPQLEMETVYTEVYADDEYVDLDTLSETEDASVSIGINQTALLLGDSRVLLSTGQIVRVRDEDILLEMSEENVDFSKENFDIEVFRIEDVDMDGNIVSQIGTFPEEGVGEGEGTDGDSDDIYTKEVLIPLSFVKQPQAVVNDILVDTDPVVVDIDPSYVEHYMDIRIDDEIEDEVFCSVDPKIRRRNVFLKEKTRDCSDPVADDSSLYESEIAETDGPFGEDCS
jgi:hypothetical protein